MTNRKKPLDELSFARVSSLGRLLLMARRDFLARSEQRMRAHGYEELSGVFVSVLPYIDFNGTRSTQLAERAGMSKQAVAKVVKKLEEEGLLVRTPDATDKRAYLVSFTELGIERLQQTYVVVDELEREYARILGKQGRETLRGYLRKIIQDSDTPRA